MARTNYIAGNWKMNTTKEQAVALASDLVAQLKGKTNKYMIGVPFVYLDAVAQVVKGSNIILAPNPLPYSFSRFFARVFTRYVP